MTDQTRTTFMNPGKLLRYAATAALSLLALYLLVLTAYQIHIFNNDQFNTITVTGTGKSAMVPNIATINFSVDEKAPQVADAQAATTKRIDAALAALDSLGVKKDDLKTTNYSVNPEYENMRPCFPGMACPSGTPKITGYQVSQSIEVKIRDTSKAGEALQALGTVGVQNISGPNFKVDEDSALATEARTLAIKDAQEQAKRLAKDLDVSLGEVTGYYEEGQGPAYPMSEGYGGDSMAMMKSAPTLPMGKQEQTSTVQVTYRIR